MTAPPSFLHTAYFFGCRGRVGHYLIAPGSIDTRTPWHRRMECLDGDLAPLIKGRQHEHIAAAWRLTGYTPKPYSALSWWDRSVDKRQGSNIILFAPGHTVTADDILGLGRKFFNIPSLCADISILPEWREKVRPQ